MIISSESTFHDNTGLFMVVNSCKFADSQSLCSDTDDLYQIALLIDQLKHDETALRINAANSLTQIGFLIFLNYVVNYLYLSIYIEILKKSSLTWSW